MSKAIQKGHASTIMYNVSLSLNNDIALSLQHLNRNIYFITDITTTIISFICLWRPQYPVSIVRLERGISYMSASIRMITYDSTNVILSALHNRVSSCSLYILHLMLPAHKHRIEHFVLTIWTQFYIISYNED